MAKPTKIKKRVLLARKRAIIETKSSKGNTIAMLPSATLKYREGTFDPQESTMKHSRSQLMPPASPQDVLRPTPAALFVKPHHAAEVIIPWLDSVEPSRWTSVCSNNILMGKILRANFLHKYEWFTFLHKDYFFQNMAAARQRFCSPLLVNSLFALAC
ncbi:hypothetical protein QSH57_004363 [Fusarium oxysporum f. sp. vasinfectum]|nr:hypothetical protein QSH57_004363 [Fusarium oxysporum f. sp. vasinfectum]